MLIPYGTDHTIYRKPVVTLSIVFINVVIFVYQLTLGFGYDLNSFFNTYALNSTDVTVPTLFSSLFLHGGFFHLLGNMWMLLIVGPVVEDKYGSIKFLVLYLLSGVFANLFQLFFISSSEPTLIIGASGCIFGIIGAFAILYPYVNVKIFYWLYFFWMGTFTCSALILFGIYFILNVFKLWIASPFSNVAYGAHAGGFIVGALASGVLYGFKHFVGEEEGSVESLKDIHTRKVKTSKKKKKEPFEGLTIDDAREQLKRLIFLGDAQKMEGVYSQLMAQYPDLVLEPGPQFDLGVLLAEQEKPSLALHAFERLIDTAPQAPISEKAMFEAARLCLKIPGKLEEGRYYLTRFLQTELNPIQYQEASHLLEVMEHRIREEQKPAVGSGQETPQKKGGAPHQASPRDRTPEDISRSGQTPSPFFSSLEGISPEEKDVPTRQEREIPSEKDTDDEGTHKKISEYLDTDMPVQPSYYEIDDELGEEEEVKAEESSPEYGDMNFVSLDELGKAPSFKDLNIPSVLNPTESPGEDDESEEDSSRNDTYPKRKTFAPITEEPTIADSSQKEKHPVKDSPTHDGGEEKAVERGGVYAGKDSKGGKQRSRAVSPPKDMDWKSQRYFILIPFKVKIHFGLLCEAIAQYNNVPRATAERMFVNGKGIVLHDVPYRDTLRLLEELGEKGQQLIAVAKDERATIPPPRDILTGWFYSDYVELQIEDTHGHLRSAWQDVIFLSCGSIDCEPGRGAFKNIFDVLIHSEGKPLQHLRLWETTFDFKSTNLPVKKIAEDNFFIVVREFYTRATGALRTRVIKEMLRERQLSPRHFGSMRTYENYMLWSYLSHFGSRLPKQS